MLDWQMGQSVSRVGSSGDKLNEGGAIIGAAPADDGSPWAMMPRAESGALQRGQRTATSGASGTRTLAPHEHVTTIPGMESDIDLGTNYLCKLAATT